MFYNMRVSLIQIGSAAVLIRTSRSNKRSTIYDLLTPEQQNTKTLSKIGLSIGWNKILDLGLDIALHEPEVTLDQVCSKIRSRLIGISLVKTGLT